jgi:hypothetical protein
VGFELTTVVVIGADGIGSNGQNKKEKTSNNDLQNITPKYTDRVTLKTGV